MLPLLLLLTQNFMPTQEAKKKVSKMLNKAQTIPLLCYKPLQYQ